MKNILQTITLLLLIIHPAYSWSGEIQRLFVDLDGDKLQEVVVVSVSPRDEDYSDFTVRIGNDTITEEFYSNYTNVPRISIVIVDRSNPSKQLLVEASDPASCIYYLLSYKDGKIVRIHTYDSGPYCEEPRFYGNGKVDLAGWEGFWTRWETYKISDDGMSLLKQHTDAYAVLVNAVATKSFVMENGGCKHKTVAVGKFIKIEKYDLENDKYFLRTLGGACGWLNGNLLSDHLGELPWAN